MKNALMLALAIGVLAFPALAVPENITTGLYKVSFDIGLTRDDYNVTVPNPKETEQLSGAKETDYSVEIRNNTGLYRVMTITIKHFEEKFPIATGSDFKKGLSELYKNDPRFSGYISDVRTIDGANGAILNANIAVDSEHVLNVYEAVYQTVFDTQTIVEIISSYPWDEGTLQLLKTIHVEEVK